MKRVHLATKQQTNHKDSGTETRQQAGPARCLSHNQMMETERIKLRRWQDSDAEALFKYASDPDVGPRAGWPAHQTVEESLEIIRTVFHNDCTWAIVLKETDEAIGAMGYFGSPVKTCGLGIDLH